MGASVMGKPLRYLGVSIVALLVGTVCAFPVFILGLAVPMYAVWPLALCFGALLAAISAGWMGTLFATDRTQSRMLLIIAVAELTAIVLAGVIVAIPMLSERGIDVLATSMGLVAVGASWVTWRYRRSERHALRDAAVAVGLVILMVLIVMWVVQFTCSTGVCVA